MERSFVGYTFRSIQESKSKIPDAEHLLGIAVTVCASTAIHAAVNEGENDCFEELLVQMNPMSSVVCSRTLRTTLT